MMNTCRSEWSADGFEYILPQAECTMESAGSALGPSSDLTPCMVFCSTGFIEGCRNNAQGKLFGLGL